jgi:hypothetical protein
MRAGFAVAVAVLLAGCRSGSNDPAGTPGTRAPSPGATATTSPSLATPRPAATPSPPPAFADVDWTRLAAPGRACFSSEPIRLRPAPYVDVDLQGNETVVPQGQALVPSDQGQPADPGGVGPRYVRLTDVATTVRYGSFGTGGRVPVAAVQLVCDNNGGTAAGQLLFSIAVYTVRDEELRLLALITPRQQLPDNHVTVIEVGQLSPSGLSVDEAWYGPEDATCCPTGRATSRWEYADGGLRPAGTRITRRAHQ